MYIQSARALCCVRLFSNLIRNDTAHPACTIVPSFIPRTYPVFLFMSSPSHPTTNYQSPADRSSVWMPEPEPKSARMYRTDLLNVPSTTPSNIESISDIHPRIQSVAQEPAPFGEHCPPSPISPLHLGPSILPRCVSAIDDETPPAPYPLPQHLKSPRVFPAVPRETGFDSLHYDNLNGMSPFPPHGCTARVCEPEHPRLPSIHHFSELCRTELPVAGPNTALGTSHLPNSRFPPFTSPTESFNRLRPCTRSHVPSRLPLVPRFEEPYFLDTRTIENDLSIRDLITLATRRDLPLRSMIIDRLHRIYGSEVPVFPGEAQEFERSFKAPWPGPLRLPTPEAPMVNPLIAPEHQGHDLSGSASARNGARAANRRTSRMDLDFITNRAILDSNDLGCPEPTDGTGVHNNGHRNPTQGEDPSERSSERNCDGTWRSRGGRKPYNRSLVINRRLKDSSGPSGRNEESHHASRQASPLLGLSWIGHRDGPGSPSEGPDDAGLGDWMIVGGE